MKTFLDLAQRVADLERRLHGLHRYGTVAEVDPKAGTVRLNLGAATGGGTYLSAPIPYAQTAGALKLHNPPSAGQQMLVTAPNGDPAQAIAQPMAFSAANASPSEAADSHVLTFGGVNISLSGEALVITVGGSTVEIGSGSVSIQSPRIDLN